MMKSFFLSLLFFLLFPICIKGAVLYFEPLVGEYYPGNTFIVEVKIDAEGECLNAVSVDLEFSDDILELIDFSHGQSIITLWVESPNFNEESGVISFSGGIPGGYCGIVPGDPGKSDLLVKIAFKIPLSMASQSHEDQAAVRFLNSSKVLLNDGLGTEADVKTQDAVFHILSKVPGVFENEWQQEIEKDTFLPEPFTIEIHQNPAAFDNKYFIIFSTTDKQTGIDYWEVKEGKEEWQRAQSPYLLKDQLLKGIIRVRAVDKAGNERIEEYRPMPVKKEFSWGWAFGSLSALIGVGLIIWIFYQRRKISLNLS